MRRASCVAIACWLATTSGAVADDLATAVVAGVTGAASAGEPDTTRATVATQLAAELDVVGRTLVTVEAKLTEASAYRVDRLRAAYRALRAPVRATAGANDRMAAARRRAGARLVVARATDERALLADEVVQLQVARGRTLASIARVPTVSLPPVLESPARGTIARRFGTLDHERSRATLARRGLDLEVELRSAVTAPADGVVRYAGPIRGLEHGVILEHGDYFTVVAKLGDLVVPVGATVRRGDRLGRAAVRRVYLELRVRIGPGGVPIDPEPQLRGD